MLLALLGLQEPAPLVAQPTTIEVSGYQCVQNTLPDGRPDTQAPDNFYIRTKSTYYLAADSDNVSPDEKGYRQPLSPKLETEEHERYTVEGRASKQLSALFKEVLPPDGKTTKPKKIGWGTSSPLDQRVSRSSRIMVFHIQTVVEKVETHTLGKQKSTRRYLRSHWSVASNGVPTAKPFVPRIEKIVWFESGPGLFEPPVYGYGEYKFPKDSQL